MIMLKKEEWMSPKRSKERTSENWNFSKSHVMLRNFILITTPRNPNWVKPEYQNWPNYLFRWGECYIWRMRRGVKKVPVCYQKDENFKTSISNLQNFRNNTDNIPKSMYLNMGQFETWLMKKVLGIYRLRKMSEDLNVTWSEIKSFMKVSKHHHSF